jgi:hypothetical protein
MFANVGTKPQLKTSILVTFFLYPKSPWDLHNFKKKSLLLQNPWLQPDFITCFILVQLQFLGT